MDYFYDEKRDRLRFVMPKEATWAVAVKGAKFLSRLGYGNEWEVVQSVSAGVEFYRHVCLLLIY